MHTAEENYWRNAFVSLYEELSQQEPPEGSGLASILDDHQDYYDKAALICHCGRGVHYSQTDLISGEVSHRNMCKTCDAVRCDAYPLDCPYRSDDSVLAVMPATTGR